MTDFIQPYEEGSNMETSSLRPQSTFSHMSIAEEYVVESRCTERITSENPKESIVELTEKENFDSLNANNWAGNKDLDKSSTPGENYSLKD